MTIIQDITYRYGYHISPKRGWLNDPNGLCWFKGKYHVFYQTNPFDNQPGNSFWGHFTSEDLVNWQQETYALEPSQDYDVNGCYSGSAIVVGEKLYLMYTGHRNLEAGYSETQCLAVSDDGKKFYKLTNNPIITTPPKGNTSRFRDPKIWHTKTGFNAVIGGESTDNLGQVNLYQASSIEGPWVYRQKLIVGKNGDGKMWECPDFFELDGQNFLFVSPKEMMDQGIGGFSSVWIEASFDLENTVTDYRMHGIDEGYDFYAPQTFWDQRNNRRIMFAWFGMPGMQEKETANQVGALTLPREVVVRDNCLCFSPLKELVELRKNPRTIMTETNISIGEMSEILLTSNLATKEFMLYLSNNTQSATMQIEYKKDTIEIKIKDSLRKIELSKLIKDVKEIRLFLDKGLTELYINDGEVTFTNKCELLGEINMIYCGEYQVNIFDLKESIHNN